MAGLFRSGFFFLPNDRLVREDGSSLVVVGLTFVVVVSFSLSPCDDDDDDDDDSVNGSKATRVNKMFLRRRAVFQDTTTCEKVSREEGGP